MSINVDQLVAAFPNDSKYGDFAKFEYVEGIQRFVGEVVNHEFRGLSVPERQTRIWNRLRELFGDELKEISLVLAFSPDEWEEVGDRAAS